MEPLTTEQLTEALDALAAWELRDDALHRTFVLADFRQAIAFIVRLGFEAEQRNHHPSLTNVYNRVGVAFTTHDAGNRVTAMDVEMAHATDAAAEAIEG